MPSRFPLSVLRPGATLKVAIFHDGGILLPAGTQLTERHLRQLVSWEIETIETETTLNSPAELMDLPGDASAEVLDLEALGMAPQKQIYRPPGYDSDEGKTYVIEKFEEGSEPIILDQNLIIQCDVIPLVQIESSGSIHATGTIGEGARIVCKIDFKCAGKIAGTEEARVTVEAGNISVHEAEYADLTSKHDIVADALVQCVSKAGAEITVMGQRGIVAGVTEAGTSLTTGIVSGAGDTFAVLRSTQLAQKQKFLSITRLEKGIADKQIEFSQLEKTIEVVKILGEKVVTLPTEKKQELARQSKRYMEVKGEIENLRSALERIREELIVEVRSFDECTIKIGKIMPGIEVSIGTASLRISSRQNATGYYLKNGRIMAQSKQE